MLRLTVACLGDLTPTQHSQWHNIRLDHPTAHLPCKPLRFWSGAVLVWEHPDPVWRLAQCSCYRLLETTRLLVCCIQITWRFGKFSPCLAKKTLHLISPLLIKCFPRGTPLFQVPTIMVLPDTTQCKLWRKTWLWVEEFIFLPANLRKNILSCVLLIMVNYCVCVCVCLIHFRACHLPIHPHWWSPHVAKRWTLGRRIKRYCHCQILKLLFPPLVVHPRHQPHQRGSSRQWQRQLCPGHGHISSSTWKGELSFLYTWWAVRHMLCWDQATNSLTVLPWLTAMPIYKVRIFFFLVWLEISSPQSCFSSMRHSVYGQWTMWG